MPDHSIQSDIQLSLPAQRTTEINDLIGNPPNWLLNSGIMLIAMVTGIILTISFFFNYPDILPGTGKLTSTTPPIKIISRANGYIEKIHIEEDQNVNKGDAILYINNITDGRELVQLQKWIDAYEAILDPKLYGKLEFVKGLQLGDVQGEYARLQLKYNELQQTLNDVVVFQQINHLSREIEKIKRLNVSQMKEKIIYKAELELANKNYMRNESLHIDGAISDLDFEMAKTSFLQKERQYEGMNNIIIQNNIRIEQLELEKLRLGKQRSNSIKEYQFTLAEIIARIRSSIINWTHTYTVLAPASGKITYSLNITEQKNLNQGETIGYIIPDNADKKYVSAIYPTGNIGKIENGQKTILRFDAYPYKEFGSVVSRVESVSQVPSINNDGIAEYEVKIPIEEVIITDYDDTIRYKPNMTLQTAIITEDKTVFERVFDQFLSLVRNQ
jgi:multidrug resistance efflux pump